MGRETTPGPPPRMDGPVKIVGWKLSLAIRAAGWSQAELARRIGVSEGHVSRMVNEETRVSVDTLAHILNAFGNDLTLADLVDVDPRTPGAQDTEISDVERVASRRFRRRT